ncbi:MAG TPA: heme-copper oxidase subunit III [Candidatus Marinimicrobia bacterium]|nr:heme-copper oxidase subunit III [Candidatus Neomarinimicrobiota bacterium]HIB32469.1 heme-copper oxidase subunit III [Candidatus Neomarinimicrobiota bacterium]
MEIPYIVDEREDTGLINSKLGIWIFLASEVMLFGGLFSAYVFLRMAAPPGDFAHWGAELNVPLATLNTLVLITSSVTMVMSWASLKLKDFEKYKIYMALTLLCAAIFLVVKYFEYTAKFHHDIFPSSSTFMAIYFTLTGLHGLHIIGGMIVITYLWMPFGNKIWHTNPEHFTNRVEVIGLYWHFVDLVWIFLFPVLYLI